MGEAKRKKAAQDLIATSGENPTIARLRKIYRSRHISPDQIAFYDTPEFIAAEAKTPLLLRSYTEWVVNRPRDATYEAYVRRVVPKVAGIVGHRFLELKQQGACLHLAGALVRMFEKLGIWSFVLRGSTNILNLDRQDLGKRYWQDIDTLDHVEGITGHAWVCAPPYLVVDISLKNQHWDPSFVDIIPETILIDVAQSIKPTPEDVVSDVVRADFAFRERKRDPKIHFRLARELDWMVKNIGAWQADVGSARLRYVPSAATLMSEPLEEMGHSLRARPIDIWNDEVKPALA